MPELNLIRSALFDSHGIAGLFSERHNGVSPAPFDSLNFGFGLNDSDDNVRRNFQLLKNVIPLSSLPHTVKQIHGIDALWCEGEGFDHTDREADILLTDQPGCAVAVRTADCQPILLADPIEGIVAAIHAGWRGTAQRVVMKAVSLMCERGSMTKNIIATLGPCIGPCCFETGEDVAQQLADCVDSGQTTIHHSPTPHVDMTELNRLQLIEAGIMLQNIEVTLLCTHCLPDRFFSHRRDAGITGRHLAVVALPLRA